MTSYVLYKPTVPMPEATDHGLAARPTTLSGKKIGLLWNAKVNADIFLKRIRELIEENYEDTEFVFRAKPTASKPMEPEVFADLRGCDVVVTAFGD
jgi:hypothetical protein